ncbi:putative translation initiation factor 6 (aeIF-6) [Candidatus Methanoperedens nitroreducens]|uniref:Translation initiation factor 6 n=1 Tax=Candidatus Methanoperedens nitratireducens TaxID=1392998 RepID=A0A062UTX1_9EURY|nr:translation initiation factor IF-6 [Candidatus Methanoperedens nitroreducens]KCZ70471.1 putative translation initiation factor 6 (aeIF-6) [Candidatus Methanoperedens nitroreducens]MDJ1420909.1 translation initiation factor IF-6 [Candidatus Methanoperedens sp.]
MNILGSPVIGVFATCTDGLAFVPYDTSDETIRELEESLGVTAVPSLVGGSTIVGSLMRGNTAGIVVADFVLDGELRKLRKHTRAARLSGELNAAGNIILANDTAALVHPDLSDRSIGIIKRTLGVDARRGTIGGLKTVGMAAIATNRGVLVHPRATTSEIAVVEELFNLPVDIGTINFGSPLVGSGLLANSRGYVAGEDTTGPELARIEDTLGYV